MTEVENKLAKSEDYIRTLEMTVELLQREIEHLRNSLKPSERIVHSDYIAKDEFEEAGHQLQQCKRVSDVEAVISSIVYDKIQAVDIALFTFDSNKELVRKGFPNETIIQDRIKHLEEQGFIDWALENNEISIIPDFEASLSDSARNNIMLLPLKVNERNVGIFVAIVGISNQSLNDELKGYLKVLFSYTAFMVDNLISAEEISFMNKKLSSLNKQMFESSKLASIGEISGSIAREIENPIKIIKGNLQLLNSGVGDLEMRSKIIDHQVDNISSIVNRLKTFSETQNYDSTPVEVSIKELIDEVLLFLSFQMQREDIGIDKNYDESEFMVLVNRAQLEQAFMNVFLHCKDMMTEGGKLSIGLHKFRDNRVSITVSDTGTGLSEQEIDKVFEPTFVKVIGGKTSSGLYLSKYIIEQHRGSIAVISTLGRGTTFKIIFPLRP